MRWETGLIALIHLHSPSSPFDFLISGSLLPLCYCACSSSISPIDYFLLSFFFFTLKAIFKNKIYWLENEGNSRGGGRETIRLHPEQGAPFRAWSQGPEIMTVRSWPEPIPRLRRLTHLDSFSSSCPDLLPFSQWLSKTPEYILPLKIHSSHELSL